MAGKAPWLDANDPASWVPAYRLIVFNASGVGFSISELTASSDDEALELAHKGAQGRAFEVWDAAVMIGRSDPTT